MKKLSLLFIFVLLFALCFSFSACSIPKSWTGDWRWDYDNGVRSGSKTFTINPDGTVVNMSEYPDKVFQVWRYKDDKKTFWISLTKPLETSETGSYYYYDSENDTIVFYSSYYDKASEVYYRVTGK